MIKATHHWFYHPFFRFYSLNRINRHFKNVWIQNQFENKGLPVLMIGNHFSWWDGFIANYVNIKIIRRKFHIMMLEEQLRNNIFLSKAGAYSIKKQSRSMLDTFTYTRDLLKDEKNIVAMYPQGKIESVYHFPFVFEKGIEHLLKGGNEIQIVFLANLVDYFSDAKPSLYIYLKNYEGTKQDHNTLEEAYNRFYDQCRIANNNRAY